jgi:NAD(P)-dependent dehydrogenase (short-subunit alcohol dehydrogenase family)
MASFGKTAVVTGASRGVGRGVACALHDLGWRVFATGRSIATADLPVGVERIVCDHLNDEQTADAFASIFGRTAAVDLLVNCVWGGYERMLEDGRFTWPAPFLEQPMHRWDAMMNAGVRAAFVCSARAAPAMIAQRHGLIVNVSFWAAQKHVGNTIYGVSKAATDKLTADMAHELKSHGVAVVSLYPGLVRTEAVLEAARSGAFDLSTSESPQFIGRVAAALCGDPTVLERSGQAVVAAAAARELNVADIDGKSPAPLTLAQV